MDFEGELNKEVEVKVVNQIPEGHQSPSQRRDSAGNSEQKVVVKMDMRLKGLSLNMAVLNKEVG